MSSTSTPVSRIWLLAAAVVLLAGSLGFGGEAAERVRSVTAAREPVLVHDGTGGWAESPSLDATAADAFVAYQVTEDKYSGIYLARVPRTGGVLGKPSGRVRIDGGREVAAWPAVALEAREDGGKSCGEGVRSQADRIWVAWSSCRGGRWVVKGCLVECGDEMKTLSRTTLSAPGGFQSQVRVKSACGVTCFVWVRWDRDAYSILARIVNGKMGRIIKVYEGPNPVGRPDVHIIGPDRIMFAWDEYAGGGFVIRSRGMAGDIVGAGTDTGPGSERAAGLATEAGAESGWEPHLAGRGSQIILAWNAVPSGGSAYGPRAWTTAAGTFDPAAVSLPTDDTWRVRCFSDSTDGLYLAWTTRVLFRSTGLYVRRISPRGTATTHSIAFSLDKNFMNTFDCKMDRDLLVAWDYSGAIYLGQVDSSEIGEGPAAPRDARVSVELSPEVGAAAGVPVERPGVTGRAPGLGDWEDSALYEDAWAGVGESRAALGAAGRAAEWPDSAGRHGVFYQGESLNVYFGDYHNHTSFSDGRAYPDISLLIAKDSRCLDFAGITDHDVTATPGELAWTGTVARYLSAPGRFAALHGFEASKGWAQHDFGHWSILFPGAGEVLHFESGMTPPDLYRFARRLGALAIPHHVAKRFAPHQWDYFDPAAERAVEICSLHGIFESLRGNEGKFDMVEGSFVEDGLARGYVFGLVGGSDSHNCFDAATMDVGLTGVYAAELTPHAVLDAMAKHRTFALTAGRTVLDFRCNGRLMGEEVEVGEGRVVFTGYASSPDSIVSAEIVSAGEVVYRSEPKALETSVSWEASPPDSQTYYYFRVATSRGDFAWSSPIWIRPTQ